MSLRNYNPVDWYWIVADDQSKVWSSARAGYVSANDEAFVLWTAGGNLPTRIASIEELSDVFAAQYPAGMLTTYANARQWSLATSGRVVQLGGRALPFKTDPESLALINGKAYRLSMPGSPTTVNWQIGPTEFVPIAASDFTAIAIEIADWVQATFDALPAIFAGIEAGSITTTAQIDAALAAVS
jgi:hypothetical protein